MKNISSMVLIISCLFSICYANYNVSGIITDYITESPIESCYIQLTGLSPNSEGDSVYSNANGEYLLSDIPGGVYAITISHIDYDPDSVQITLDRDTSNSFNLYRSSHVLKLGHIPDTLKKENSPYLIYETLHIINILYINPGVQIILIGGKSLSLKNDVFALGTEAEPIIFTADHLGMEPSSWENFYSSGITLEGNSSYTFKYCEFINITRIQLSYSAKDIKFKNCYFSKIYEILGFGANITVQNYFKFIGNTVVNCIYGFGAMSGAHYMFSDTLKFTDNLISCSEKAFSLSPRNGSTFRRNTIIGKGDFYFNEISNIDSIISNIFTGITFHSASDKTPFFAYNNIISFNDEPPTGVGDITTENSNGTASDFYFNIQEEPLFSDTNTGALLNNSPCIAAGFNGENIGVYQGGGEAGIKEYGNGNLADTKYFNILVRDNTINIKISLKEEMFVTLLLYDFAGNKIKTLINEKTDKGQYNAKFNAEDVPEGVYICNLKLQGISFSKTITTINSRVPSF